MVVNLIMHRKISIVMPVRSINIASGAATEKLFDNIKGHWRHFLNFHSSDNGKSTGTQLLKTNLALPHKGMNQDFHALSI